MGLKHRPGADAPPLVALGVAELGCSTDTDQVIGVPPAVIVLCSVLTVVISL